MADGTWKRSNRCRLALLAAMALVGCSTPQVATLSDGVPAAAAPHSQPPSRAAMPWPAEWPTVLPPGSTRFAAPGSNYVLDFHGSSAHPDLVLFMAGNQYRALPELVAAFRQWATESAQYADLDLHNIFYATLPPGRLIEAMQSGKLVLGNYWFDVAPGKLWPDVFMTGPRQQKRLKDLGHIDSYTLYARNRGAVLLVRKGNPLNLRSVADLARPEVRVAISSPQREPASFDSYAATLRAQGGADLPAVVLGKPSTVSPAAVHHRENAQFVYDGRADVALMYAHFGSYLKQALPDAFDCVELPEAGNFIDSLGISLIKSTTRRRAAQAWIEFMRSEAAAAVYERNGFRYASPIERTAAIVP